VFQAHGIEIRLPDAHRYQPEADDLHVDMRESRGAKA
jgi:hypothetical protein